MSVQVGSEKLKTWKDCPWCDCRDASVWDVVQTVQRCTCACHDARRFGIKTLDFCEMRSLDRRGR
jgi:hypothetical protein